MNYLIYLRRPILKYVYMLEFHPSLALAAAVPKAIQHVLQVKRSLHFHIFVILLSFKFLFKFGYIFQISLFHHSSVLLQVFLNANHLKGFLDVISIEKILFELIQKEWDHMDEIGICHSQQTQKDVR